MLDGKISSAAELEASKRELAARLVLDGLPTNPDILAYSRLSERDRLKLLWLKPTRTLSGVAVIAAMTSPARCPHGVCIPCPGGSGCELPSPQSYTGREPAAMRAAQQGYDPYRQVSHRISQLAEIGHPLDKAELIVMGGTITSRPIGYQSWFVKRCIQAMNDYPESRLGYQWQSFQDAASANAQAFVRNVAITFETRPDWCTKGDINRMLMLGVTKVELGVQSTRDEILRGIERGCTLKDTVQANRNLRKAGLKVGFHMMPGLPGSSLEQDLDVFKELFENSELRPDYLKIYPTLVIPGTRLFQMYQKKEFTPLQDYEAAELISEIKAILPPYTRLQRVQRDIPASLITAGVKKSNLRQLSRMIMEKRGERCRCIRCREAGLRGVDAEKSEAILKDHVYIACDAEEHFISFDTNDDTLVGFLRLRLDEVAMVRELHVYGPLVPLGRHNKSGWQHRGYGARLLQAAEQKARDAGYRSLRVTSGIGVRDYYSRLGYLLNGPYMIKEIL